MKVVDLFAGAGGLSYGFEKAGFTPTAAIEIDEWAAETFRRNHDKARVYCANIEEVNPKDVLELPNSQDFIIIGGPPCQGFSHSNVMNKDPKDPRNSLFREFIRFVDATNPAFCLLENVPGLLTSRTEKGVRVIKIIQDEFTRIGYSCEWTLLNAAQYGVPQNRSRLFIAAYPQHDDDRNFQWPNPTHVADAYNDSIDMFDREKNPLVTLWEAISDLPQITHKDPKEEWIKYRCGPQNEYQKLMRENEKTIISHHEPMRHTDRIVARFNDIKTGMSERDVAHHHIIRRRNACSAVGNPYDQNSRRQDARKPCSSIVASSHTNYIHPFLNRNFTVRELMRVQSFPDHYGLYGKRAVLSRKLSERKGYHEDLHLDQRMQIGNAVPPLLAKAIAESIYRFLFGNVNNEQIEYPVDAVS